MKKLLKGLIPSKLRKILKNLVNFDASFDERMTILNDRLNYIASQNKQILTNTEVMFRYVTGFSGIPSEREIVTSYYDAHANHLFRYKIAAERVEPGDKVLDFACGCGYGTVYLNDYSQASHITGADINPDLIEYCKKIFGSSRYVWKESNFSYKIADLADSEAFPENYFDKIISFETIEHVPNSISEQAFKNIHRWLKPALTGGGGGIAMISVPNEEFSPFSENPERYSPYHFRHYTPRQFGEALKKAGFQNISLYYEDTELWRLVEVGASEKKFETIIAFCQK